MQAIFPKGLRSGCRPALVVAHPGHELRVHGWLEAARPRVAMLTDGSGRGGKSRLPCSQRLLEQTGATLISSFGALPDTELYQAILHGNADLMIALADHLAAILESADVDYVVSDAAEGYNPAHDLCRALVDAAVSLMRQRGKRVRSFDFLLDGEPSSCPSRDRGAAIWHHLDDAALERKLQAARSYPAMALEVNRAIRRLGLEAFRTECLRPVRAAIPDEPQPYYELHGQLQVRAGFYAEVVRQREHLAPLLTALAQHVKDSQACARCES